VRALISASSAARTASSRPFPIFRGTNRLAEIFLGNGRAGSDVDTAAKDSAVVCSIALQHHVPVDVIRHALLRDARGVASSPLGTALDALTDKQEQMR
jgi:hypothetical protein